MPKSAEDLGFQFGGQAEVLWHLRGALNNHTTAAAGGNVLRLKCPGAEMGDIVRHTGGDTGEVGYVPGMFTYGAVVDTDTARGDVLVKLLGEVRVRCATQAIVGRLALVCEDGSVEFATAAKCDDPARIIGVVCAPDTNGRCRIVLGQGRECALCSPLSSNFIGSVQTNGATAIVTGLIALPSLYVHGPCASGIESVSVNGSRVRVTFSNVFKRPPIGFSSLHGFGNAETVTNTTESYLESCTHMPPNYNTVAVKDIEAVLAIVAMGEV